jgi:hypothetical protein
MEKHLTLGSQSPKSGEKVTRRRAPFSTIRNDFGFCDSTFRGKTTGAALQKNKVNLLVFIYSF